MDLKLGLEVGDDRILQEVSTPTKLNLEARVRSAIAGNRCYGKRLKNPGQVQETALQLSVSPPIAQSFNA